MPDGFALSLEPLAVPHSHDATAGTIHDPLWFLCRQWQLGEFQGENASTPVQTVISTASRPIAHPDSGAHMDEVPPEPLIEAEPGDWWTLGRRLRIGAVIAQQLPSPPPDSYLIADPPPPYDLLDAPWDGRALWRDHAVAIDPAVLPEIPAEAGSNWLPDQLVYRRPHAFHADGVWLDVPAHRGGRMDWYSIDADVADRPPPASVTGEHHAVPARLEYPGMPRTGVWEIEDARADIGALAPDSAHTATAIMQSLLHSHRDEWFDVPVPSAAGRTLRIVRIDVVDAFGEHYVAEIGPDGEYLGLPGLHPPRDPVTVPGGTLPWGLFHTRSLPPGELVLWQVADRPLHGEVVERVQFGVDDRSNVVWAVERRLGERDPEPPSPQGTSIVPPLPAEHGRGHAYEYVPSIGAAAHWIPYTMTEEQDSGSRTLVQRQLADLSRDPVTTFGPARAAVLAGNPHTLRESVVPLDGLEVERRWMLARDAAGNPHLWIRRRRRPLTAAPARTLRFDVAAPTDPADS